MCDKILFLGDIHIGARNSSKIFRQLFREYFRDCIFPMVKKRGVEKIIQLGDFFDNRNSLSLHDIDYILTEFIPLLEASGVEMYVLAGNHDVAYKNTNVVSSLTLLKTSKSVHVIDNDIEIVKSDSKSFVLCPWINEENYDHLIEDIQHYANKDHILCGHFEFKNMKMYRTSIVSEHGFDPKDFKKFYKVVSGHFHYPSTYGNVSYLGSVFHLNWQDHGDQKCVYIFDTNTDEFEPIENVYSLFTELDYYGDNVLDMTDDELKDYCEGQFVRIVIDQEYKRVDLKDLIHKIEKTKPISVDVIDETILDKNVGKDDNIELSETKDINDYLDEYLKDSDQKSILIKLFNEVQQEAEESIKEIE